MEPSRPRKLLDQVRDVLRIKHYSYRTEETYVQWIRRFILFHNKRHPAEMGTPEVSQFLTHLAVSEQVAAATHLLQNSYDICTVQELLGHKDAKTTMILRMS